MSEHREPHNILFLCTGDSARPIRPGKPLRSHWGVPDPAAVEGSDTHVSLAFADACRMLGNRIRLFASLPIDKLDELSLKREMDAIGRTRDAPSPA